MIDLTFFGEPGLICLFWYILCMYALAIDAKFSYYFRANMIYLTHFLVNQDLFTYFGNTPENLVVSDAKCFYYRSVNLRRKFCCLQISKKVNEIVEGVLP